MTNLIHDPQTAHARPHKYLVVCAMLWLTFLLVSVFTTLKTFEMFGFVFFAAVIAYPFTYVFADIFTEVYGYRTSRKIIWTGFICLAIATSLAFLYTLIPPSQYFTPIENEAFKLIFQASPAIAFATLVGFWAGENVNSIILARLKIYTNGNKQGFRYVFSTFIGQIVENILSVGIIIVIANLFTFREVLSSLLTTIFFVTAWEIIALPITYRVIRALKQAEGIDVYDHGTNLNPFKTG